MGTAHAGHDQCAHCYFQYIKPALQAERQDVKRRRELKRLHLSPANRALISAVDLQEPQMVDHPEPPARISRAIRNAIDEIEIDHLIAGKTDVAAFEAVTTELVKLDMAKVTPPLIPPHKEAPIITRHAHAGGQDSHLSVNQVAEVIDAYQDGMPVMAICEICNIATTTLYAILREARIPLRGRANLLPKGQSTMPVSIVQSVPTPANGRAADLPEWVVTYTVTRTETTIVAAKSFNDAAATITEGDVISVSKKLP